MKLSEVMERLSAYRMNPRRAGITTMQRALQEHAVNMLPKLVEAIQYHIGEHSSAAEADTARVILDEVLAEAEEVPGI
jgi:hypothetical protein